MLKNSFNIPYHFRDINKNQKIAQTLKRGGTQNRIIGPLKNVRLVIIVLFSLWSFIETGMYYLSVLLLKTKIYHSDFCYRSFKHFLLDIVQDNSISKSNDSIKAQLKLKLPNSCMGASNWQTWQVYTATKNWCNSVMPTITFHRSCIHFLQYIRWN